MSTLNPPIGILGGTFDPIHIGHLRLALEAYDALRLAKVHLVPCFTPVHRSMPIASPNDRLAMLLAATKEEPALFADPCEILRRTPSYMIDTLETLRLNLPNTPFCLIIGLDAFLEFHTWRRYHDIAKIAHIIVAHRPNVTLPTHGISTHLFQTHQQTNASSLHQSLGGSLFMLQIAALDISASTIRKQITLQQHVRYLIPETVYQYI